MLELTLFLIIGTGWVGLWTAWVVRCEMVHARRRRAIREQHRYDTLFEEIIAPLRDTV